MERKSCTTCKSRYVRMNCEPCNSCRLSGKDHPLWEPKVQFNYVEIGPDVGNMTMDVNSLYPYKPNKEILRQLSNYTYGYKPDATVTDEVAEYCKNDVEATMGMFITEARSNSKVFRILNEEAKKIGCKVLAESCYKSVNMPEIKKVIFNDPATIVMWDDGTKTVVKTQGDEAFDPEKGLAMAISKKALGNKGNYFDEFKKWLPEEKKEEKESTVISKISVVMDGSGLKDAFDTAIAEVKRMEESIARKASESSDNNWKDGLIKYLQSI